MRTIIFLICLLLSVPAGAHPGRLDAKGCHTNRKTGGHHCHGGAKQSKHGHQEAEQTLDVEIPFDVEPGRVVVRRPVESTQDREAAAKARVEEREHECAAAIHQRPKPVCNYDGSPGDWTCKLAGCPVLSLPGVRVGAKDTDPCSWINAIGTELMLEAIVDCNDTSKACKRRDECIDKMRDAIKREHTACSCAHPTPPGVRVTTVCRAERWDVGNSYKGFFGENKCALVTPPNQAIAVEQPPMAGSGATE